MRKTFRRLLPLLAVLVVLCMALATPAFAAGDPTEEAGTKMIECSDCGAGGLCMTCYGHDEACEDCGGTFACASCEGTGYVESPSKFYNTGWALLPPIIAIALALITKEVYSSLFIGIVVGGLLYSNFTFETTVLHVFNGGILASVTDGYNMGILVFLVILGAMVCLMNRAGGSAAFGRWAQTHIKSRVGAQIATFILALFLFIDDYFSCLTLGSVMRPVTDKHNVSRAKLAYLIDATAAPICIIAPISSWAAAVAGFAEDGQGLQLFIRAIPFNFYALLTLVMVVGIAVLNMDYGPMAKHEMNALQNGDLFSGKNPYATMSEEEVNENGRVIDLVFPILALVVCCVIGMIYTGGFFSGENIINAFSNCDASQGLMMGSAFALVITMVYYLVRRSMKFVDMMGSIPEGFKAMVPAILILTFAWSLKSMTDSLGAKLFVRDFVYANAESFQMFLPAIIFLIGCVLAFATGTSWGTFGILIPIVQSVFPMDNPLAIVCISACMAGAVCGDHCSPISDTTIMASAGAQCEHIIHVETQLPYALTVAALSFVGFVLAGFVQNVFVCWAVMLVVTVATLLVLRKKNADK